MMKDQTLCSCGRTAVWIGKISGENECQELVDKRRHPTDKKVLWKDMYKDGARHEREEE
jgi:hypothetical protein